MSTLKDKISLLEREQREEVKKMNADYREKIRVLREDWKHEYGEWFMRNGEIPDTNLFCVPFERRTCRRCKKMDSRLMGSK